MAKNKYSNSGVEGSSGYEFQKHCALYILLEQYNDIKDTKYFIFLEHYEDFLFAYMNKDEIINKIETYQAKKSTKKWTITNKEFEEIIIKILNVGIDLRTDDIEKCDSYFHNLHFISNREIDILKEVANERRKLISYSELGKKPKDKINSFIEDKHKEELECLRFKYIPLSTDANEQKYQLIGKFSEVFDNKVISPKSAVETILSLFRKIELTFNQNNNLSLKDVSKKIDNQQINKVLNIINTQQKAFALWRSKRKDIVNAMKIPYNYQEEFESSFNNSFDLFKDLKQVEHIKIYKFVENEVPNLHFFHDYEGLQILLENFIDKENTTLTPIQLKATIYAAFVELFVKE
ncbi:dsDNA nuclease domain-containing protein [Aliarcobacter butzleri]|uniref:dsDNA nuclease domain-containing protein n=1 Tax=Aliarcobacter butzleri TaxID=28197 RepID=UPI002B244D15|nr:dsDNA nuclease domain-containing protein [Aliarcobacter butzleri]